MDSILHNAYLIPGLVNDIVLEIFLHFVAVDPDGPFTLMLVGTNWRDLVFSNSRLWTWITVDDSQTNWKDRAQICVALSRHLPIQMVLRMPFDGIKELLDSFPRCKVVFLEIPKLRQPSSRGCRLVTYEEFFEGRTQYEEIYNLVAGTLSSLEGRGIRAFVESADDACFAYSTWTIFERMFSAKTLKDQQTDIPLHLIKTLIFKDKPNTIPQRLRLLSIWPYLHSFSYLQSLDISDNFVGGDDPSTLSTITLPSLRNLSIECVTGWLFGTKGRIFDIFSLLSRLDAPVVCNVSLYGSVNRLLAAVGNPNNGVHPSHLNLSFMSIEHGGPPQTLDKAPIFRRLQQLTMDFSDPYRSSIGWPTPTGQSSFQNLKSLIPFISENCILSLHGGEHLYSMVQWDMPKVKALNLAYRSGNYHNKLQFPVPPGLRTFKLKEGSIDGSHYIPWVQSAAHVIVEDVDLDLLLGRIFPLPLTVEVLDTCTSTMESHNDRYLCSICSSYSGYQGCFPHLATLRSTAEVAKAFIEHFDLENLREITLCTDESGSIGPFDSFVSAMAERNPFPPRLQILGIEVFPPWSPLLCLVSMIRGRSEEELITVKLPGFPHPSMLRLLLDALKNKSEDIMEESYDGINRGEGSRVLSCSACLGSGWTCYKGTECDRFLPGTTVSITNETYIGEDAMY